MGFPILVRSGPWYLLKLKILQTAHQWQGRAHHRLPTLASHRVVLFMYSISQETCTRFLLCCGYTLTDFPISIRLTSPALWQSNDCPSASKATLMNMDKYFMWIHYERLHNHNKAKHNKTVCIFLGIYCRKNSAALYKFIDVICLLFPYCILLQFRNLFIKTYMLVSGYLIHSCPWEGDWMGDINICNGVFIYSKQ